MKGVKDNISIKWNQSLANHNISAALEYLNLHIPKKEAERAIQKFLKHKNRIEYYKAKDIFRASGLQPLPLDNEGVAKKQNKVNSGTPLDPILLVKSGEKLYVSDGYHRASYVYDAFGENERVACVLIGLN